MDYADMWDIILSPCGETQREIAEKTGIFQQKVSQRLRGATGSASERWAVAVAAAALLDLSAPEREKIIARAQKIMRRS